MYLLFYRHSFSGIAEVIWNTYGKLGFVTRAVNFFQEVAECCGVLGPEDWVDSAWYKPPSIFKVPKSCCQVRHTFSKNVYSPISTKREGKATSEMKKRLRTEISY